MSVAIYLHQSINTRIWKRNMLNNQHIQYRHLIPAPVDRTSASFWLYKHPWVTCQKISQTHQYDPYIYFFFQVLFYFPPSNRHVNKQGTKDWPIYLANQSYVRLGGHPSLVNWVTIGRAVVCYAGAAHSFNAGFKYRHCTYAYFNM